MRQAHATRVLMLQTQRIAGECAKVSAEMAALSPAPDQVSHASTAPAAPPGSAQAQPTHRPHHAESSPMPMIIWIWPPCLSLAQQQMTRAVGTACTDSASLWALDRTGCDTAELAGRDCSPRLRCMHGTVQHGACTCL